MAFKFCSIGLIPIVDLQSSVDPKIATHVVNQTPLRCSICLLPLDLLYRIFYLKCLDIKKEFEIYCEGNNVFLPLLIDLHHKKQSEKKNANCRMCWFCLRRIVGANAKISLKQEGEDPISFFLLSKLKQVYGKGMEDENENKNKKSWSQRTYLCPCPDCENHVKTIKSGDTPYFRIASIEEKNNSVFIKKDNNYNRTIKNKISLRNDKQNQEYA